MRALFLIATLCALCACSKAVDPIEIPGRYQADHGKGQDILDIAADGTYSYSFASPNQNKVENKGKWSATSENGKVAVTFEHFRFGLAGYGTEKPAFWVATAERCKGGAPCFCLDPDLNYYYTRSTQ